jgi:ATP citrate (pro-S)-lyase
MKDVLTLVRKGATGILVIGNHPAIIQSILDFDYLSGKSVPSVLGSITSNRKAQKFFFGKKEMLIPCYKHVSLVPPAIARKVKWMLNMQSSRRTFDSTCTFFETFPHALGGHLFAENVPEFHATKLIEKYGSHYVIAGPSGVGILVSGHFKLGAIGGVDIHQIAAGGLSSEGSVAVVSTSGGMTNELIRAVSGAGKRVSFSISIGGDRFPVTSLTDVLMLAENDTETKAIVYFGELGGSDEYEIVELLNTKKLTKPILCYIAGVIDEAFDEHMQFGHAKALVARQDESARAKRAALNAAGAIAPDTFPAFLETMKKLPGDGVRDRVDDIEPLMNRTKSILSTREIVDIEAVPQFVKGGKLIKQKENAFASAALAALIGCDVSPTTAAFIENIFELLIDHGGNVSGAVNTMVTARAGKDMVSALAAGLLTIGPRFGGAVNEAARAWAIGVNSGVSAADFVESKTRAGELVAGIGHKKYRVGIPDPRVAALSDFAKLLKKHPHYDFARSVEKVTTGKNGNLILNVDGVMAALLLDLLSEKEGMTQAEISELIDAEFFNALFIIPRTVGFISHFIEQKRNDEGLFRLPDELLFERRKEQKREK